MKIVILIIASNDLEHENDSRCQAETWITTCEANTSIIFLRGWDKDFYYKDKNTLFVPCREEYSQILNKTILGIKYIIENIDFDILIRSNVSTYFEPQLLVKELSHPAYKGSFFGGYFDKSSQKVFGNTRSFEYISGTGIFLSKYAATELCKIKKDDYKNIHDDLAIFHFLDSKKIRRVRMARNNLHSTHIFIPTYCIRTKNSTDPESASKRMKLIHNFFQSRTIKSKIQAYLQIEANELYEFLRLPEPKYLYVFKCKVAFISFLKMKLNYH